MTPFTMALACCVGCLVLVPQSAPGQPEVRPNGTAVVVNGEVVTVEAWVTRMKLTRPRNFMSDTQPPQMRDVTAGQVALEWLINSRLLMQYAAKTSLLPTGREVDAALAAARKQPTVQQAISTGLITESDMRDDIRFDLTLFSVATVNERVSEAEVEAYYKARYKPQDRWRLSVIRVTGREAAERALTQLKGGTPFATVAARVSEDEQTRSKGGEIGLVAANDPQMAELVRAAIAKLRVGEYAGPIQTSAPSAARPSFVFVRLTAKETVQPQPLDQVRATVERQALLDKVGGVAAAQRKVDEFRKTSRIEVFVPGYSALGSGSR